MKNSVENKVMNTAKEAYVKPAMEVYEMEMDAAVLVDTQVDCRALRLEKQKASKILLPVLKIT